jgi:hypothetical protein
MEETTEAEGLSPLIWGPLMWDMLHSIASTYPQTPSMLDKKRYYTFVVSLAHVLPCPSCRNHFRKTLLGYNFDIAHLESRDKLMRLIFDLHNIVNERLKKPDYSTEIHYAYMVSRYETLKQGVDQGISPLLWGPKLWFLIHAIASTYASSPAEIVKKRYYTFIISLAHVLPCLTCREHFKKVLLAVGFNINHLANRETFFRFTFDLHNAVNIALNKPDFSHTYDNVKAKFETLKNI